MYAIYGLPFTINISQMLASIYHTYGSVMGFGRMYKIPSTILVTSRHEVATSNVFSTCAMARGVRPQVMPSDAVNHRPSCFPGGYLNCFQHDNVPLSSMMYISKMVMFDCYVESQNDIQVHYPFAVGCTRPRDENRS